jgi:hypothetical protein
MSHNLATAGVDCVATPHPVSTAHGASKGRASRRSPLGQQEKRLMTDFAVSLLAGSPHNGNNPPDRTDSAAIPLCY